MKYSKEELRRMAVQAMAAKAAGDVRFMLMIGLLSMSTGLSHDECQERIKELAA